MLTVFDAHTVQAVAPNVLRKCSQWQRGEHAGEARAHKKLLHEVSGSALRCNPSMNDFPLSVPAAVAAAMAIDFGMSVTAYLVAAVDTPPILMGTVFGDTKERFREGASIRTSRIQKAFFIEGYSLFKTAGGSLYVVVSWVPPGNNVYMNRVYH